MNKKSNDLWGSFQGFDSSLSPFRILREQSDLLTEKTFQRLNGRLDSVINSSGQQRIEFTIYAPALKDLVLDFLVVEYDLDLYPVEIKHNGSSYFCDSESSYLETLKNLFSSEETRRTITSLLVQIRYSSTEILDSVDSLLRPHDAPKPPEQKPPEKAPRKIEPEEEPKAEETTDTQPVSPEPEAESFFPDLKPGQQLQQKGYTDLDEDARKLVATIGNMTAIFIRNICTKGLSISFRARNDKQFEVIIPHTAEGKSSFDTYFLSTNKILENWVTQNTHKTNFPEGLL